MSSQQRSENEEKVIVTFTQWVSWIGAILASAITLVVFVYSTFQTKTEANDNKSDLYHRLERIENKIDSLLTRN